MCSCVLSRLASTRLPIKRSPGFSSCLNSICSHCWGLRTVSIKQSFRAQIHGWSARPTTFSAAHTEDDRIRQWVRSCISQFICRFGINLLPEQLGFFHLQEGWQSRNRRAVVFFLQTRLRKIRNRVNLSQHLFRDASLESEVILRSGRKRIHHCESSQSDRYHYRCIRNSWFMLMGNQKPTLPSTFRWDL